MVRNVEYVNVYGYFINDNVVGINEFFVGCFSLGILNFFLI